MCECKYSGKKVGRWVNIQKKKIFMKKILIVFYCVHFFYWSSFRKNFILMSLFLIFSNKIFMKKIIVVLQLQFLLISISCSFLIKKHFAARHGLGNGYLLGNILLSFYWLDYWGGEATCTKNVQCRWVSLKQTNLH